MGIEELKKKRRISICITMLTMAFIVFAFSVGMVRVNRASSRRRIMNNKYQNAIETYDIGRQTQNMSKLDEALEAFIGLDSYKESDSYIEIIKKERKYISEYQSAQHCLDEGRYLEAAGIFHSIIEYNDSKEKEASCIV